MPSTESQLRAIVDTLNKVQNAAQTRSAIGAALVALHHTYPIAESIGDDRLRQSARAELDGRRLALERWYRQIVPTGLEDFRSEWSKHRRLVEGAYITISGVEGMAGYTPRTSHWEILRESVNEGLGTVTSVVTGAAETAGLVVGGVAGAAGKGAGTLLGGLFSGLGVSGVLHLAVIGAVVLLVVNRGTVLGKVGGLIGKVGG